MLHTFLWAQNWCRAIWHEHLCDVGTRCFRSRDTASQASQASRDQQQKNWAECPLLATISIVVETWGVTFAIFLSINNLFSMVFTLYVELSLQDSSFQCQGSNSTRMCMLLGLKSCERLFFRLKTPRVGQQEQVQFLEANRERSKA